MTNRLGFEAAVFLLGWLLALGTFFVGIQFIDGIFMWHDLRSLLAFTGVATFSQFLLCTKLASARPRGSKPLRVAYGVAVGLATAVVPVVIVNFLAGGAASIHQVLSGIGGIFLTMFCVSGVVFGASLANHSE